MIKTYKQVNIQRPKTKKINEHQTIFISTLSQSTTIIAITSPKRVGIRKFITNQQNIYRVTPVHYLQK